jgi:alpha-1,2-mannosyltransferase
MARRVLEAMLTLMSGQPGPLTRWQSLVLGPPLAFVMLVVVVTVRLLLGLPDGGSFHIYSEAAEKWWAATDPYGSGGIHGFLYLPASIVLFTPFALAGPKLGGAAWCVLSAGLYGSGLVRLVRRVSLTQSPAVLAVALLATLPSLNRNLSDGQAQVIMTGLLMHGAGELASKRPWRCAAFLALAVAFKPIAIAMPLLVFVLFAGVRLPLVAAAGVIVLLPVIRPDPSFAVAEYSSFLGKIAVAGTPVPGEWPWLADVATFLEARGIAVPPAGIFIIRALAAACALFVAWRARFLARPWHVCTVLALSLTYLTLFNPRTESDAYVALTPMFGLSAGLMLAHNTRSIPGWAVLGAGLALGIAWNVHIDAWLKPLLALIYILFWTWSIFDIRARERFIPAAPASALIPARRTASGSPSR